MNPIFVSAVALIAFANDNSAYVPQIWANEGLAILEENMVMAGLVHRDFSDDVRDYGDTVNTRRPATRTGRRKTDNDDYEEKDVSATNVKVVLDQLFYDSFIIKDKEASLSFQDLVEIHLEPAMQNIARMVDRAILGRVHSFIKTPTTRSGRLNNMSADAKNFVLQARELLNKQKAYVDGRNLVLAPSSETALLGVAEFLKANERGDGGRALENARLGRILGFDTFMDQNANFISDDATDTAPGTVTNALAAGGSGSQAVTITGYNVNVGEYISVAGNDQPTHATARTLSMADTTAVTLNEANKFATLSSAVLKVYKKCDVNGSYLAGYAKEILVDGHTASKPPQVGQLISFGTGGSRHTYTIIEATAVSSTSTNILLDRPLELAVNNDDLAFPGPSGAINLAFHRNSIALVSRALAAPASDLGVKAGTGSYNGVGMRVVMQYDSKKGGTRVNLDILAGVAILDPNLATLILG